MKKAQEEQLLGELWSAHTVALVTAAQANPRPHGCWGIRMPGPEDKGRLPMLTRGPKTSILRPYTRSRTSPETWWCPRVRRCSETDPNTRAPNNGGRSAGGRKPRQVLPEPKPETTQ